MRRARFRRLAGFGALLAAGFVPAAAAQTAYPTGGMPVPASRMARITPAAVTRGPIPPSYDLTPWMPAIGSQGQQGSCAAWAVAWAARSLLWARTTRGAPPREPFSPAFLFNSMQQAGNVGLSPEGKRCWGTPLDVALAFGRDVGFVPESVMPYSGGSEDCIDPPSPEAMALAPKYRLGRFAAVPDLETLKQQIASGYPVVFQMRVGAPFFSHKGPAILRQSLDRAEASRPEPAQSWHALVVVGYDDNLGGGAVRIANSWAAKWGDAGYAWVSYDAFVREATFAGRLQAFALFPSERAAPDAERSANLPDLLRSLQRADSCAEVALGGDGASIRGFVSQRELLDRARSEGGAASAGIDLVPWPGCEIRQRFAARVGADLALTLTIDGAARAGSESGALAVRPGQQVSIAVAAPEALRFARLFYVQSDGRVKSLGAPQSDGSVRPPADCPGTGDECGFLFDDTSLGDEYFVLVASDRPLRGEPFEAMAFADLGSDRSFLTTLAQDIGAMSGQRVAMRFARVTVR